MPKKKGPKINKPTRKFLDEWIKGVLSEVAGEVRQEELARLDVSEKVLKGYVKGHVARTVVIKPPVDPNPPPPPPPKESRYQSRLHSTVHVPPAVPTGPTPMQIVHEQKQVKVATRRLFEENLEHSRTVGMVETYREAMLRQRELFVKWRCVKKLQAQYRKHFESRRGAATTIQKMYKGHLTREFARKRKTAAPDSVKLANQAAARAANREANQAAKRERVEVDLVLAELCEEILYEEYPPPPPPPMPEEAPPAGEGEEGAGEGEPAAEGAEGEPPAGAPSAPPEAAAAEEAAPAAAPDGAEGDAALPTIGEGEEEERPPEAPPAPPEEPPEPELPGYATAQELLEAWGELSQDQQEDEAKAASILTAGAKGMLSRKYYRSKGQNLWGQQRQEWALSVISKNVKIYKDKKDIVDDEAAAIVIQSSIRRFLAMSRTRDLRLERGQTDDSESIVITDKPKAPYAASLTKVVAHDSDYLDRLVNQNGVYTKHANVRLLQASPHVSKPQMKSSINPTPVTRAATEPLVTQSLDVPSVAPTTPGPAASTESLPVGSKSMRFSTDTTVSNLREGARSRLLRCRENLSTVKSMDMDTELEVLLWMRMGAPPVYHMEADGDLKPDPYAPSKLFPPPSGHPEFPVPKAPEAWKTKAIRQNKERRLHVMKERKQKVAELMESLKASTTSTKGDKSDKTGPGSRGPSREKSRGKDKGGLGDTDGSLGKLPPIDKDGPTPQESPLSTRRSKGKRK